MADSSVTTSPILRRPVLYGLFMMLSVVLTSEMSVVGACLALVFLCLLATETAARAVLGLGLMALGGLQAVSLLTTGGIASGLPILAAGLVPAIMLAPRSVPPRSPVLPPGDTAPLDSELAIATEKLELLRATDLDEDQARFLSEALAHCEAARDALDRSTLRAA